MTTARRPPPAMAASSERPHRGIEQLLHPQVLGVIIGGSGASAFVHVNKDVLPGAWASVAALLWSVALAICVYTVLLRPRQLRNIGPSHPRAGLIYSFSVVGMLVGFATGRVVLGAAGRPELMPAVVVIAVGLHFVPFASAFKVPVFGVLGRSVAAIGIFGLALGLAGGAVPVASAAVVTGVVMLLLMALDAVQPDPAVPAARR